MSHETRYVVIWAVLLAALFFSIAVGAMGLGPAAIAVIFVVAAVKAGLVVGWYMHLALEPRFLKTLIGGTVALVAVLFFGLFPDIVWMFGHTEARAEIVRDEGPVHAGDAVAGATVYTTYCVACHQADGKGMDGKLAANFVDDPTRLSKSDEELLASIRDGTTGTIGTMPPWGAALSAQQRVDVLAYVRATYGRAP
jgi:caa(3)-type oxidase subunit IV